MRAVTDMMIGDIFPSKIKIINGLYNHLHYDFDEITSLVKKALRFGYHGSVSIGKYHDAHEIACFNLELSFENQLCVYYDEEWGGTFEDIRPIIKRAKSLGLETCE
ncbi:MAG: hypothetical protein ABIF08_03265 [Nanoarchaeota archaeon]